MKKRLDYSKLTALVTGASSGLGVEFVRTLHQLGVGKIIITARRAERLESLKDELSDRIIVLPADLSINLEVERLISAIPRLDILINNAGFGLGGNLAIQGSSSPKALQEMVALNCTAVMRLSTAWLQQMSNNKAGWILNVGSIAGMIPTPSMAVYGATKAFVNSFTESLRVETRGTGVSVHLLAPGPVNTEFFDVAHEGSNRPPDMLFKDAAVVSRSSLVKLFSDRARYIPGPVIFSAMTVATLLPKPFF